MKFLEPTADTKSMVIDNEMRGDALAEALRSTGLLPNEIAAACGVTRQAVDLWLAGRILRRPHEAQREKIAALLERTRVGVAA